MFFKYLPWGASALVQNPTASALTRFPPQHVLHILSAPKFSRHRLSPPRIQEAGNLMNKLMAFFPQRDEALFLHMNTHIYTASKLFPARPSPLHIPIYTYIYRILQSIKGVINYPRLSPPY